MINPAELNPAASSHTKNPRPQTSEGSRSFDAVLEDSATPREPRSFQEDKDTGAPAVTHQQPRHIGSNTSVPPDETAVEESAESESSVPVVASDAGAETSDARQPDTGMSATPALIPAPVEANLPLNGAVERTDVAMESTRPSEVPDTSRTMLLGEPGKKLPRTTASIDRRSAPPRLAEGVEPPPDSSRGKPSEATRPIPLVEPPQRADQPQGPPERSAEVPASDRARLVESATIQSEQPPRHRAGEAASVDERAAPQTAAPAIVSQDPSLSPAVRRALEVEMLMRTELASNAGERGASASGDGRINETGQPSLGGPSIGQHAAHESPVERASPVESEAILNRVVRGMHAMIHHRGGLLSMRLQPPELGQIRIQMIVHGHQVTAHLEATTPEAHGLLHSNLAALQMSLEQHGLAVERLSVHLTPALNPGEASTGNDDADDSSPDDRDAADGRSRGRSDEEQRRQGRRGE